MPPIVLILPKKDAVEAARAATAHTRVPTNALVLNIFCDASYKRGNAIRKTKAGAALAVVANILMPLATKNQRTSKACFIPCDGPDDNSTTAEAFALAEGAHVALDQIARMEVGAVIGSGDRVEIVLWSDCQTVLEELGNRNRNRTPQLTKKFRHIIDIIELKTRDIQHSRSNVFVQFLWCPAECVEPHETADELSKRVRIAGGSGAKSKALHLFDSLPHRAIQSALEQPDNDESQSEADESADTPIPATTDGKDLVRSAALHLPDAYKEVMLEAIKLQEKVTALRTKDQAQAQARNQAQASEEQDHKPTGQGYEHQDNPVKPGVDGREQDGFPDEDEDEDQDQDQFHDAQEGEPEHREDGDVDGELAIAGDVEARPSRMRALWSWVRGRPRL